MPANVVKTKEDERLWNKAKGLAEDSDHKENWPYIMEIFQRMKGNRKKASAHLVATAYLQLLRQEAVRMRLSAVSPEIRDPNLLPQPPRVPDVSGGSQTPPARDSYGRPIEEGDSQEEPSR